MALRDSQPTVFRARTASDAIDSTNGPQGAMLSLANLVPSPSNQRVFVPRPAAVRQTTFTGFTGPLGVVELAYIVGNRCYGFVQSNRFPGKSEPFIWDYVALAFITISNVTNANTPTSTSNTGDWVPPSATAVGSDIVFTHPGFPGSGINIGWLDETGFTSNTLTATTVNLSPTLTTLSSNPIAAGVTAGMSISGTNIPAGTSIVSLTTTTITMSANATGGTAGVTLTIAGGTFAAPRWSAGNVNQNPLPSVPLWVASYAGSAWYAVGAAVQFSDVGAPLQQSNNPNPQVINYQNGLNVTCLSGSPYQNALGSISQSLLVFQGLGAIYQITGSAAAANLSSQLLADGIGTLAPNSVTYVPNMGTGFIAADGLRFATLQGGVTVAVGTQGDGISNAFLNAVFPSRMNAAWNSDTLRIAVINNTPPSGATVTQEFWFNTKLNIWTGPHSFQTSLITATQQQGGFIICSTALGASLWLSHAVPTATDGYVENGATLTCGAMTSLLPDNESMSMNALNEMAVAFGSINGFTANIIVYREDGNALDALNVPVTGGGSTTWGSFTWGMARWGANNTFFTQYQVPWSQPLLFKQCFINITFPAGPGNSLGNMYLRIQRLGYLLLGENDAA